MRGPLEKQGRARVKELFKETDGHAFLYVKDELRPSRARGFEDGAQELEVTFLEPLVRQVDPRAARGQLDEPGVRGSVMIIDQEAAALMGLLGEPRQQEKISRVLPVRGVEDEPVPGQCQENGIGRPARLIAAFEGTARQERRGGAALGAGLPDEPQLGDIRAGIIGSVEMSAGPSEPLQLQDPEQPCVQEVEAGAAGAGGLDRVQGIGESILVVPEDELSAFFHFIQKRKQFRHYPRPKSKHYHRGMGVSSW